MFQANLLQATAQVEVEAKASGIWNRWLGVPQSFSGSVAVVVWAISTWPSYVSPSIECESSGGGHQRPHCGCVPWPSSFVLLSCRMWVSDDPRPTTIDKRLGLCVDCVFSPTLTPILTLLPLINSGRYMAQTLVTSIRRPQSGKMCGPWPECEKRLSRLLAIKVSDELAMPTARSTVSRGLMIACGFKGQRLNSKSEWRIPISKPQQFPNLCTSSPLLFI